MRHWAVSLVLGLSLATPLQADRVASAAYLDPTDRYPHAVLGDAIEWGTLLLRLTDGSERKIVLPERRVFEDLAPRVVDLDGDGSPEVITIESDQALGARLSIWGPEGLRAANEFIGRSFRWLAPVGAADFDGDGIKEVAFVDRPHLAKTLRVFRFTGDALTEIAAIPGLTNHRIGEDFITGGIEGCETDTPAMLVASADWRRTMRVTYDGTRFVVEDIGPFDGAEALDARTAACR